MKRSLQPLLPAPASPAVSKLDLSATTLAQHLQQLLQQQINGQIQVQSSPSAAVQEQTWTLDFRHGRICWAAGGEHRFRRWRRLLRQHCPELADKGIRLREEEIMPHWEHLALTVFVKRGLIPRAKAIAIAQAYVAEVFFDIFNSATELQRIDSSPTLSPTLESPLLSLSWTEILQTALPQLRAWHGTGLGHESPNRSPLIRDAEALRTQVPPATYQALQQVLTGQLSLREIAASTQQDLTVLARYLTPFVVEGVVVAQSLPDYLSPYREELASQWTGVLRRQPLIMAIDNSPQVGYFLEEALQPYGYRVQFLQDAISALAAIVEQQPNLIFLDMTMPVVQGHELCAQLRRLPEFKTTPIILLANQLGFLNRAYAMTAGATDCLVKPLAPEDVLATVQRYVVRDDL